MTPEEARHLAQRLRSQRESLGLSISEVARRARLNVGTVFRIEQGVISSPRAENLLAIAAVLHIPASDIFVFANWLRRGDLPSFKPYMRTKYGSSLPEEAYTEIQEHFERVAAKYGVEGPSPGDDEY